MPPTPTDTRPEPVTGDWLTTAAAYATLTGAYHAHHGMSADLPRDLWEHRAVAYTQAAALIGPQELTRLAVRAYWAGVAHIGRCPFCDPDPVGVAAAVVLEAA